MRFLRILGSRRRQIRSFLPQALKDPQKDFLRRSAGAFFISGTGGIVEMLDDFREWLSDNLRYILLGLAIVLVVIILFCIVRLVTSGSRKKQDNNGPAQTTQTNTGVEKVTESGNDAAPTAPAAPAGDSSSLTRNDAAVLTLAQKYYEAVAAGDVGTLSQIVTPWNDSVQESILSNDVIEKYNNVTTYSKQGLDAGSYVVYVYYEGKVADFDTLVPSLSRQYVITGESGDLVISNSSMLDSDVLDYINTVSGDADVRALREDVNRQYEEALASDPELAAFIDTLDAGSAEDDGSGETATEAEAAPVPTEMTAIAGLNIRETPSTEATILGSVAQGTNVTVLEEAGDGWVHIHYTAGGSDITGYVRLEYLTAADQAA